MSVSFVSGSDRREISHWMYSHINEEQKSLACLEVGRIASKSLLAFIALARSSFFIPISLKLPCGGLFAAANLIGNTSLQYWVGSRCVNAFLPSKLGEGKVFDSREKTMPYVISNIAIGVIALVSQLPSVYPAMEYHRGFYSIPIGLIVMIGGAFVPLCSMKSALDKRFNQDSAKNKEIDFSKKEQFVEIIQESERAFIRMNQLQRNEIIKKSENIRDAVDSDQKIEDYWNFILSIKNSVEREESIGIVNSSNLVPKAIGWLVVGVYQYVSGIYTFAKTKENVWDNNVFASLMAIGVVASTLYLTGTVMVDSVGKLHRSITQANDEAGSKTLIEQFYKRKMTVLHSLGKGVNFLSLGLSYVIWRDFFDNKIEKIIAEAFMCTGIFLLLHASTPALINSMVEEVSLLYFGTSEEKKSIRFSRKIQSLSDSINRITPENFEVFFAALPESVQKRLLNRDVFNEKRDLSETTPILNFSNEKKIDSYV